MIMIYISGPVTGTEDYVERFERAEKYLNKMLPTTRIVNPVKVNGQLPEVEYRQYMGMSMCMLGMCNAIYMLKGWEESVGAKMEYQYAEKKGYAILYEK